MLGAFFRGRNGAALVPGKNSGSGALFFFGGRKGAALVPGKNSGSGALFFFAGGGGSCAGAWVAAGAGAFVVAGGGSFRVLGGVIFEVAAGGATAGRSGATLVLELSASAEHPLAPRATKRPRAPTARVSAPIRAARGVFELSLVSSDGSIPGLLRRQSAGSTCATEVHRPRPTDRDSRLSLFLLFGCAGSARHRHLARGGGAARRPATKARDRRWGRCHRRPRH